MYTRERADEARASADRAEAAARERRPAPPQARQQVPTAEIELRRLVDAALARQTPIGEICADRGRPRCLGFFTCGLCAADWRSNECYEGVPQTCPSRCLVKPVLPFKLVWRLDREDNGRAEIGFRYFGRRRAFGRFQCRCGRTWQSAFAWRDFTEDCKGCGLSVSPFWLEELRHREGDDEDEYRAPHDSARCGKCRALGHACHRLPNAVHF